LKKRSPLSLRQLILYAALLLAFTILILSLFGHKQDQRKFSRLTSQLFAEEMLSNTLNMHYTLASPEDFGIYDYEPVLPAYDASSQQASRDALESTLNKLAQIRPERLTKEDAYTYELLVRTLQNSLNLLDFPLYDAPLSPSNGIQSQLPILLAEYTFRTKQDVEDYLALLEQTDTYFASLLTYEQERASKGLSMSTYSLRLVQNQCDTIVTKSALEEGSHFLQTTFQERLEQLLENGTISEKEAAGYTAQNDRLLRTVLQPAYESLADGLFLLEDADGVEALPSGLASRAQGQDYYRYLLISQTGSYRPVEEIQTLLQETISEEYNAICTLVTQHPELTEYLEEESYTTLPYTDADAMLKDLQNRMTDDFPEFPDTASFPEVKIKTVSSNLEEYCAPAFYLTVPLDDTDNNVIYINQKNAPSGLELYATLAHEGYPGHLYQTVYQNQSFLNRDENMVRQLLWYGGYLEGWALYVEFYGYDYASQLLQEQGRTEDALCVQAEKHNRSLLLCLYSTLDIKIHYENASREEIAEYLSGFGIQNTSAVNAVYCYIADDPCNYLKYYLGYLEILELKSKAETLWQENYSDRAFHSFLLDAGASDFTSLEERLQQY
jgi:uncharacterized protein (DUF885 family)